MDQEEPAAKKHPGLETLLNDENRKKELDLRFKSAPPAKVVAQLVKALPGVPESVCSILAHVAHEDARLWMAYVINEATVHKDGTLGLFRAQDAKATLQYARKREDLSPDAYDVLMGYIRTLNRTV